MSKELYRYPFSQSTYNPRSVRLIQRGPKPSHYRADYHPVVVCSRAHTAKWEAGWTGDGASVWYHDGRVPHTGWLLERWKGLDFDYGHNIRGFTLPDGVQAGFQHRKDEEPWSLLPGAVWWSHDPLPDWLAEFGVVMACDQFSRTRIQEDIGTAHLSRRDEEKLREQRRPS